MQLQTCGVSLVLEMWGQGAEEELDGSSGAVCLLGYEMHVLLVRGI